MRLATLARGTGPFAYAALHEAMGRLDDGEAADRLGVCRMTVQRLRSQNRHMTEALADELACRLDMHPFEVWPEWFGDGA